MKVEKVVDSNIVDLGGFAVENVTRTVDSGKNQIKIIEKHHGGPGHIETIAPFLGFSFFVLALAVIILGWVYMKKKADIAKLMIQNNMSPEKLFFKSEADKGISDFLKFGILCLGIGVALLVNKILIACGLQHYMFPVLLLSVGLSLLLIHKLRQK